ncbi:ASCH domain-containing protein [Thalassoglobus neptunius]|uniref:ASCH domain-containing protein n=1 Tax=Thalassoglobus neptunius TaxID=1938619 RepID=UPI0018D1F723|nr:ASCH domain-containing protein [Thalassoglobus neptunius]
MSSDPQQHPNPELIALAIQQPWAELILRGIKTVEIRSVSPGTQSLVYLYSSRQLSRIASAQTAIEKYDLDRKTLPTGVIVGTVTINGCTSSTASDADAACVSPQELEGLYSWHLEDPQRIAPCLTPKYFPYGMWFYPFRRRSSGPSRKKTTDDSTA